MAGKRFNLRGKQDDDFETQPPEVPEKDPYEGTEYIPVSEEGPFNGYDEYYPMPDAPGQRDGYDKTEPAGMSPSNGIDAGGETITVDESDEEGKAFRPIVGWLVCTGGNDRGKAFELHNGDNYIGRADAQTTHDIVLNDNTVSRVNTADMYYVRRSRTFIFSRMPGVRTECWFNGTKPIINSEQEMVRYDRITIGKTDLMLIPLCSDEFDWEDMDRTDDSEKSKLVW